MRITSGAACLAGFSMAGVLPTFGFIAKETWYESVGNVAVGGFLIASVLSNIGLIASVGFVCVKPFFGTRTDATQQAHEGSPAMWGPPVALGITGLVLGLMPTRISELLTA